MEKRIGKVPVRCGECGELMVENGAELSCSQPCGCTVSSEELFSATWNKVREYLRDPDAIAECEASAEMEKGMLLYKPIILYHGTMNRTYHESGFFVLSKG